MLRKTGLLLFAAFLLVSPSPSACRGQRAPNPSTITSSEFAQLIEEISEDGGYFWSNNFISNETSYQHVLDDLEEMGVEGGVYLGVGPNQNFTYIAHIRPELALIVDIRRQNMIEHLIFKVLLEQAETRQEFLSTLMGRPITGPILEEDATLEELVENLERSPPDRAFFREQHDRIVASLEERPELKLTQPDFHDMERIHNEFFRQGLDIKYDSWRSFFFPSFKEFLLETDRRGNQRNWLASRNTFLVVRDMQRENRIIPAVGDFSGDGAFRRLGALLEMRGQTVSAFYLSNVEFYLFRQRKWMRFVDNVKRLPIGERSVFIRAYANLHRPHPAMVDDHITVSLVQPIAPFIEKVDQGLFRNLWDVVTLDYSH